MMPKSGISKLVGFATVAVVTVGMAILGSPGAALTHAGHAHGESGGGVVGIVQIAATVAALVMLHVLATWFFRYRDRAPTRGAGNRDTDLPGVPPREE